MDQDKLSNLLREIIDLGIKSDKEGIRENELRKEVEEFPGLKKDLKRNLSLLIFAMELWRRRYEKAYKN